MACFTKKYQKKAMEEYFDITIEKKVSFKICLQDKHGIDLYWVGR